MPSRNYPNTVAEVLDPAIVYKRAALEAVRNFARSRPYRQSETVRKQLILKLCKRLARAYGIAVPKVRFFWSEGHSGSSCYGPGSHQIDLHGRFSVITFLHEFGHARGFGERETCCWSINLFAKFFPRSFARCQYLGHTLVRRS